MEQSAAKADPADGPSDVEKAARFYALYVMLPLWFVPGALDWYFHRKTKIEHTSGTFESVTHAMMMSIVGVPFLGALLLEVNALVLSAMAAACVAHEAVAYWDVNYAKDLRPVSTSEQQTHSFLEVLPFMGLSLSSVLHWEQAVAIFGLGPETAKWKLEPKKHPLSKAYIAGILGAVGAFVIAPYTEEMIRCFRVDRTLWPHNAPVDKEAPPEP